MNIKKILSCLKNPKKIILYFAKRGIIPMDDKVFVKMQFKENMGYNLDLENPVTYDEKLNWIKLYNKNSLYTTLVDKYEVKKYIGDLLGSEYIIPTLGIYEEFDDIDFSKLPNQFVIKCTHDSGGLVIVKDKNCLDIAKARKKISKSLKTNYFYRAREWPYKNVKPRILVEQYMEDSSTGELRDYKFYCFNGIVKALLLATNRQSSSEPLCFDYFDENFNHLELTNHYHPNAGTIPEKPINFEKMVDLAKLLSKGFPHVRVDFYEVNGSIYFGEMTFYDQAGYLKIHPDDWQLEWGNLIDLSLVSSENE